ncbi:hypothetical protein RSSM_02378 [Rhodopirellula sallentina SM41]|uniref:Uncharacterized protein n=1 Tax=Rhodopirellula sallentina SM41 TaxID=1263870 RepID=M5UEA1_9BACT|nr:hypothetical protein RSSM_02378 [Rhodopirellula sallentina SM41]
MLGGGFSLRFAAPAGSDFADSNGFRGHQSPPSDAGQSMVRKTNRKHENRPRPRMCSQRVKAPTHGGGH